MAKIINQEQYESVLEYIKEKLLDMVKGAPYGGSQNDIKEWDINHLQELASYTGYVEKVSVKKTVKKEPAKVPDTYQKQFMEFWDIYPGISKFEYMGRKFPGERVLKANKQVCYNLWLSIIWKVEDGKVNVSSQTLLKALQVQLENIRIESYKTGQNRMQYLKSCEVYLRQRAYEPWLGEEIPEPIKQLTKEVQNSTDM